MPELAIAIVIIALVYGMCYMIYKYVDMYKDDDEGGYGGGGFEDEPEPQEPPPSIIIVDTSKQGSIV